MKEEPIGNQIIYKFILLKLIENNRLSRKQMIKSYNKVMNTNYEVV